MEKTLYQKDCESILSNLKHKEKQLIVKRRWLMGLPLSEAQHTNFSKYNISRTLPESLVREDDTFYETVKLRVEEAFGVHDIERGDCMAQDTKQFFDIRSMKWMLLSRLDTLTSKALYLIVMLLTRGSANFEKTRKRMKKVIKEFVPKVFGDQNLDCGQQEFFMQLSQLLNDPKNVRQNCSALFIPTFESHYAATIGILDRLKELPAQTLIAMCRKLRGVPPAIPHVRKGGYKKSRKPLIHKARKTSLKMLSQLGKGDELQPPLAKALAIAGLSLTLRAGHQNSPATDFNQVSPEIKTLQSEISKAIWLVEKKVRLPELRTLQVLLDPEADVENGNLRKAVRQLLTDYLFECSDLETIPRPLLEAVAIINRGSQCFSLKDKIADEVEGILNLSAEIKQIAWDFLPDHNFEEDFTNAYMEELEESDNEDYYFDNSYYKNDDANPTATTDGDANGQKPQLRNCQSSWSYSIDLDWPEESIGEHMPDSEHVSMAEGSFGSSLQHETRNPYGISDVDINCIGVENIGNFGHGDGFYQNLSWNKKQNDNSNLRKEVEPSTTTNYRNPLDLPPSTPLLEGEGLVSNRQSSCNNTYLAIQEVCDDTSMVAYNVIGCILEGLAQEEGASLDLGDSSHLREKRKISSEQNVACSNIVQVAEQLVPSLSKSVITRLKELMGAHNDVL